MKNWLLIIIFGIVFVSCENDVERQKIIMTSNIQSQTKALVMDNNVLGSLGFGVMCYSKENGTFDPLTDSPNYYYNLKVYKFSSAWVTSASLYWPESAKVSFVAYAPYSTSENGITLTPSTQVGFPTISYIANNIDITKQVDLCYSTPQLNKTQNDGTIAFTFNHSLSKISFSAKNYYDYDTISGCKIKSIRLTNIINKGSILLNSNPSWTPSALISDTGSYNLSISNSMLRDLKLNLDYQLINQTNACLMLIPQNIDISTSKLEVVTSDLNGVDIKTSYITLNAMGITQLTRGQNLNIRLSVISGNVYADFVIIPWDTFTFTESTIGKKRLTNKIF
ncbi:MAG: fimbrillin family protein [Bacteroidales bacterium]|nr:fimbrillin family protein [Bacteroidales bacterium]